MRKTGALLSGCFVLLLASQSGSLGDAKQAEPRYKGKAMSAWITALEDKDPKVRSQAVRAIRSFGPRAKAAIPRLVPLLKDVEEDIYSDAQEALREIGKEAVPALLEAAKSKEDGFWGSFIRMSALGILVEMKPKSEEALPALLQAAKHSDSRTRDSALALLTHHAKDSPKALDAVIGALEDEEKSVFDRAICSLSYFGPEISKAWPIAERMMKSKDEKLRERAMRILSRIASKNFQKFQEITPLLIQGAKDENFSVRYGAVHALGLVRPKNKDAVPPLVEALKDPNKELQALAKQALWFIDPEEIEQFRVTSPVSRIKDPQKQAQAALELLLQTKDYSKKLRLLPKQLRNALSNEARSLLAGHLLSKLRSRRPLKVENMAPTSVLSRVQAGKMRSYGWQPWITQDVFLENGRCAWALEGLLDCKLPDFTEDVNRDPKQLQDHILRAGLAAIRAALRPEKPTMP